MAIYEFQCQDCGKHFEIQMPMSAHDNIKRSPPVCPECGRSATRQVVAEFACRTPAG